MRKSQNMRPHDIVILLKVILLDNKSWMNKDLASLLFISPSEVSESLQRSVLAKLIDHKKKRVNRQNLFDFLIHGLPYVFPSEIGTMVKGIPTAHSHPFMQKYIRSELKYVWPDLKGKERGLAVQPLYDNQTKSAKEDEELYKVLSLIDVLRVGKVREIKIATGELEKIILK